MKRKFGQAIALTVAGIKCDNQPFCNWQDDSVKVADYDKWLNRPCPVCGSNLLTPEDMATVKTMQLIIGIVNLCSWPFVAIYDSIRRLIGAPDKGVIIEARMKGTGEITFDPFKPPHVCRYCGWEAPTLERLTGHVTSVQCPVNNLCPKCLSFHPADQKCMEPRRNS